MQYFTETYLNFFRNLAANNHKQWFDENRKEYEREVREPFKIFVKDVINAVQKINPEIQIEPKDAIFRINRDIRFSKDKTPYKLFNSAIISKTGRKDKAYPGMYLELNPEKLGIFGGLFMPNTQQVLRIRNHIFKNLNEFENLINEQRFLNTYGEIKGKKHKRIQTEFREAATKQSLLYNKQWYYETSLSPDTILKDNLLETVISHYKISYSFQKFLIDALV